MFRTSETYYLLTLHPDVYPLIGMGSRAKRREGHKKYKTHLQKRWKRKGYAERYLKKHNLTELTHTEGFDLSF